MLNGPLAGPIILFALPLALSSMLQQLFNAADTAVSTDTSPAGSKPDPVQNMKKPEASALIKATLPSVLTTGCLTSGAGSVSMPT